MKHVKFNPSNIGPDGELISSKGYDPAKCRLWSSSGVVICSLYECLMLHLWATGASPYYTDFWSTPVWSVVWMVRALTSLPATLLLSTLCGLDRSL